VIAPHCSRYEYRLLRFCHRLLQEARDTAQRSDFDNPQDEGLADGERARNIGDAFCSCTSLKDKIQSLQLHVPRAVTAQGSSRVKQERDKTRRGSKNGKMTGR